jgi:hypothetical protein
MSISAPQTPSSTPEAIVAMPYILCPILEPILFSESRLSLDGNSTDRTVAGFGSRLMLVDCMPLDMKTKR